MGKELYEKKAAPVLKAHIRSYRFLVGSIYSNYSCICGKMNGKISKFCIIILMLFDQTLDWTLSCQETQNVKV